MARKLVRRVRYLLSEDRRRRLNWSPQDRDLEQWSARRLNRIASFLPQNVSYLEVGVFRGETISNVKMPVRVGVDPEPRFSVVGLPNGVEIFASTSDHFFLSHKRAFCFDLIFLDGLHEAKQCYSDFVNVLKISSPDSVILIDDVLPDDDISSIPDQDDSLKERARTGQTGFRWHGDVWKVVVAISIAHADARIQIIHSPEMNPVDGDDNPQAAVWRKPGGVLDAEDSALGFQVIDELEGKPFSYGVERWPSLFKPVGEKDFLASLQGFFETKQPKP